MKSYFQKHYTKKCKLFSMKIYKSCDLTSCKYNMKDYSQKKKHKENGRVWLQNLCVLFILLLEDMRAYTHMHKHLQLLIAGYLCSMFHIQRMHSLHITTFLTISHLSSELRNK
jgi:hypothetical protein